MQTPSLLKHMYTYFLLAPYKDQRIERNCIIRKGMERRQKHRFVAIYVTHCRSRLLSPILKKKQINIATFNFLVIIEWGGGGGGDRSGHARLQTADREPFCAGENG